MKLTTELIFDRLNDQYNVRYTASSNRNTLTGRPVFYEKGLDISDHICVCSPDDLSKILPDSGVFITVGDIPADISGQDIELITVCGGVSTSALFNSLQAIFDYYDAWENDMNNLIEHSKGYSDIIQCATKYLDCPISIVDEDFTIIAVSEQSASEIRDSDDHSKISKAIMNELISDPLFSKGLHNTDVFEFMLSGEIFLSYNFKKDGRYLGRVSLYFKNKNSKDAYIYLLRFLARKIEIMLRSIGSFLIHKESFSSLREILSAHLRSNPTERQYTEYRLNENGWSYFDEYVLIRLQPEFRHEWQLHSTYLIPLTERMWPGSCAVEHDKYVVVLLDKDVYAARSDKNFMQDLAYFLRDGLMLAGISRSFHGLDQIPSYYRQTELAVSIGRDKDPMCWYYCFDDYALFCWLNYGIMNFAPEQICSPVLLSLIAYDKANNTEYYKTLRTFYNKKFSYTHAAEDLYIHRTTLIKRVERIVELTGAVLDNPDDNLYNELSFRYLDKVTDFTADEKKPNSDKQTA